jgi:hypothetical protein
METIIPNYEPVSWVLFQYVMLDTTNTTTI